MSYMHPSSARPATGQAGNSSALTLSAADRGMLSINAETIERLEAILQTFQRSPVLDEAIRLPEVLSIVGLSKSTWYARLNARLPAYDARAPKPFKLGTSDRSPTAWWRSEVMAYVLACAAAQPAH